MAHLPLMGMKRSNSIMFAYVIMSVEGKTATKSSFNRHAKFLTLWFLIVRAT